MRQISNNKQNSLQKNLVGTKLLMPARANPVLQNATDETATDYSTTLQAATTRFGYSSTIILNLRSIIDRSVSSRNAVFQYTVASALGNEIKRVSTTYQSRRAPGMYHQESNALSIGRARPWCPDFHIQGHDARCRRCRHAYRRTGRGRRGGQHRLPKW